MALVVRIENGFDLKNEFARFGCENSFSIEGYHALNDLYDEMEDVELDVIAICCDYSELSIAEFIRDYSISVMQFKEWSEENEDDDRDNYESYLVEKLREYIETNGYWYQLLDNDSRIIYQCF